MFFLMNSPYVYIFGSVFLVSIVSLVGVVILSFNEKLLKRVLLYLVSFSTGALLGNVFLHFIPEIAHHGEHIEEAMLFVLLGILLSFVIEQFIHWRHCHSLECKARIHPVGPLILIGDAAHNIIDGILITTSYLINIPLGIATTTAVLLHEIPQEFGDFAVLIHSGMSKGKALFLNFLSALTAFIGVFIVLWLSMNMQGIEEMLLPLAAGNFLYIAGSDLIPELHKETHFKSSVLQLMCMIAGIALMYVFVTSHGIH
ncbi:ZIP family metal transporter [Patescibacteria group bacterium]|nr:ZIP family metal transporter [Patescibacteria group bacterium]